MMRKKTTLQKGDVVKAKSIGSHNAKVTVQYIQNPNIFPKRGNSSDVLNMEHANIHENLEIETVEYLEDNANVEEYIEEPCEKDYFEDNFYPNAIYCLLDLYKTKYNTIIMEHGNVKIAQIWRDIAKKMQESFFEFNERQIQQKYALLRCQYFAAKSKEDIENFDYFEQLHDIYKDSNKENILNGFPRSKACSVYYIDENFTQAEHLEDSEGQTHKLKSNEIVHKELEFTDIVEKELQAIEDGIHTEYKTTEEVLTPQNERKAGTVLKNPKSIRKSIEQEPKGEFCEEPPQRKAKMNEYFEINDITPEACYSSAKPTNEFTLYHYNQEQERRHREKITLLEKSLRIQERALEKQHLLLDALIKRLPS